MQKAPIPENERERLAAFDDYELLVDTPESWFDHITAVATRLCEAPVSLVSLVGRDDQFFKASEGVAADLRSGSRANSFCGHALFQEGVFEVPDTLADERFHDNPWVTAEGYRFYAGARLITSGGFALGTVCVLDYEPRNLTDGQKEGLRSLAAMVMEHLEIRRSESFGRHLNRLIESSDDFVAVADADSFRVLYVNGRLQRLIRELGGAYDPDELRVSDLFPSLDESYLRELAARDPDPGSYADELWLPILDSTQSENSVRLRITPSRVRERSILLLLAEDMGQLLSSLRQAERAAAEVRKLALVARQTQNPVIVTDADDHIEWVNPSFEKLTGYQQDEVVGRKPGHFLQGPSTDQATRRRLAIAVQNGRAVREEILNYNRWGYAYWLDLDIQPVHDDRGELTNFVAVQTDITKLKDLESSLRRARDEAEAANQAKSSFLASISHELRTPLNGIIGIAELLRRNPRRMDLAEQLATLHESADGLLAIINELLELSRIEAGAMELDERPFSLSGLARNLDHLFRPQAERKGIALEAAVDESAGDYFHGDSLRLKQILMNLLNNAIKFTEKGLVRLQLEIVPGSAETPHLVARVTDSGPGIPDSVRERIFEPFGQADAFLSRRYGGVGLGLAISRRLVELMRGSISLDSTEGRGATFEVMLPLPKASEDEVRALQQEDLDPAMPGMTEEDPILLVEDNAINRQVAVAMLEDLGATTVVSCESGEEGLKAFKRSRFSLVLLDIQMPDMSGYDVAVRMREIDAGRGGRTPILAVTAHGAPSTDAQSNGVMDAHITKPLTFQGLSGALRHWLSMDVPGSEAVCDHGTGDEPASTDKEPLIDKTQVLRNLNGDPRLVATLRDLFEQQHRQYLDLMAKALEAGDPEALADAAHSLKGAVGYFNKGELWRDVADLEKAARAGSRDLVERVTQVRPQILDLAEAVRCFTPDQA